MRMQKAAEMVLAMQEQPARQKGWQGRVETVGAELIARKSTGTPASN